MDTNGAKESRDQHLLRASDVDMTSAFCGMNAHSPKMASTQNQRPVQSLRPETSLPYFGIECTHLISSKMKSNLRPETRFLSLGSESTHLISSKMDSTRDLRPSCLLKEVNAHI
jgi:hypothetical protein